MSEFPPRHPGCPQPRVHRENGDTPERGGRSKQTTSLCERGRLRPEISGRRPPSQRSKRNSSKT